MSSILDRPLEPDEDEPMPADIDLLFSWMNEHNIHQVLPRIEEIVAHMRKLRAGWEAEGKPIKDADKPDKQIDLTKLMKAGKPLIAAPTTKMRRI